MLHETVLQRSPRISSFPGRCITTALQSLNEKSGEKVKIQLRKHKNSEESIHCSNLNSQIYKKN